MKPSRDDRRRLRRPPELYSGAPFEDSEDTLLVSRVDDASYHESHSTRAASYGNAAGEDDLDHIQDGFSSHRTRHREHYNRPHYQRSRDYDYDSTVNNWAPRSANRSPHYNEGSSEGNWPQRSSHRYLEEKARFRDRDIWVDHYEARNDNPNNWTPSTRASRARHREDYTSDERRERRNEIRNWRSDDWQSREELVWPTADEETSRSWTPREETTRHSNSHSNSLQDRSWKPALTWQPSRDKRDGHPQQRKHYQKNVQGRKNWHGRNPGKQRDRDNRQRNLDNSTKPAYSRRNSNSPSLSPARTSNSRHSVGRSRSRSQTPKRRRLDATLPNRPDSVLNSHLENRNRNYKLSSKSPLSPSSQGGDDRVGHPSSVSSESRSPSPHLKRSSLHRLPLTYPSTRASENRFTGVYKRSPISDARAMPPPPMVDLHHERQATTEDSSTYILEDDDRSRHATRSPVQESMDIDPEIDRTPPRSVSQTSKNILSEPLKQIQSNARVKTAKVVKAQRVLSRSNASVKRFFPGDEDDHGTVLPSSPKWTREFSSFMYRRETIDQSGVIGKKRNFKNGSPSSVLPELQTKHKDENPAVPSPKRNRRSSEHSPSQSFTGPRQSMSPHNDADQTLGPPSTRVPRELYEIVSQVGEGTFGKVYKARNTANGLFVALKRIRMEGERDGFPVTAIREIKLLQSLQHENVVRLYEMMVTEGQAHMVFEYMDHDLTGILGQTEFIFTASHLKSLCRQMLSGLAYLHQKGVIHRDIKGSNILVNNKGELKLADFGLARFYHKRRRSDYTNRVITLWYRPPELLLGATVYGPEVDMWSAGCIMLELFTKKPVFQGNDEIHQLEVLYKILGTPTPNEWSGILELPWFELVKPKETLKNRFRELFHKWLSPAAMDLAQALLLYDPEKRVSAADALNAAYFKTEEPWEEFPSGLANLEGEWHEYEHKRERARRRRAEGRADEV